MIRAAVALAAVASALLVGEQRVVRQDDSDMSVRDGTILEAARSGYFMALTCDRDARIPFDSVKVLVFIDSVLVHGHGLDPMTHARFTDTGGVRAFSNPVVPYIVISGPDRTNPYVWAHEFLHVFERDTLPATYHRKHRECGL